MSKFWVIVLFVACVAAFVFGWAIGSLPVEDTPVETISEQLEVGKNAATMEDVQRLLDECADLEPPYSSYDEYEAAVAERIARGC